MATVLDYLKWRSDLPLDDRVPLNDVDMVILSRFSYLPLDLLTLAETETVHSIASAMKALEPEAFRRQDGDLIRLMDNGPRFSGIGVTDYEKHNDAEEEKQFAAVTLHLNDGEMVLSYCGTDSTLVGWKEDFNMSFSDQVPAQAEAIAYAGKILQKYPEKKVHLVGHSKGGNLAVYVMYCLPEEERSRLISVRNFDGPGFHREFLEEHASDALTGKLITYVPPDSIFGRILERVEPYTVIRSTEKQANQHDVYSWQVGRRKLLQEEDGLSDFSNIIAEVLSKVMYQNTPEQRKIFIDGIFELVSATSATTTAEAKQNLVRSMPAIVKTMNAMPEEDRKLLSTILGEFGSAFGESMAKTQGEKIAAALQLPASWFGREGSAREEDSEKPEKPKGAAPGKV